MGGWSDVMAAVGGGLSGFEHKREQDDASKLEHEKMAQQERIASMREEVRQMIADAGLDAKRDMHDTPSGSVIAQQTGANGRADQRTATTERGQDLNFNLGTQRDATTRELGTQRDATTRRGQNMSSADRQRGQNLSDDHYWDESKRLFQGMQLGDQRARTRDAVDAYGHVVTAGKTNALGLEDPKPVPSFSDWFHGNQNLFSAPPASTTPAPAAAPAAAPGAAPVRPAPPVGPRPAAAAAPLQKPIPGLPGALAESTDGGKTWHRVK